MCFPTYLYILQVLKKADMIRKNAVESILAERNILISVRNPFVVSRCNWQSILLIYWKGHHFLTLTSHLSGSFLLFIYLSRKFVSCNGVLEWRRSVFITEKSRLLRWRCCSSIYSWSCKLLEICYLLPSPFRLAWHWNVCLRL